MPDDLLKQFLSFARENSFFSQNEKIGIAVSGGLDSVVLFHLFLQSREKLGCEFVVLHFNHKLRRQADQDARFVTELCARHHIPCEIGEKDVAQFAADRKLSIEMAARECRYAFFDDTAEKFHLDKIATAHTASDQAETILLHIIRGTGVEGLRGIPVQRDCFIRPLLFAQRDELYQYAQSQNLRWREDHSNKDESFTRNRIRHTVLPLLRNQFNPQIVTALNRLGESARESSQILHQVGWDVFHNCVTQTSPKKFVLEIDRFLAYLKSLQRLVLQHVFEEMRIDPRTITFNKLDGILDFLQKRQSGTILPLAGSIHLFIDGKNAVFRKVSSDDNIITLNKLPGTFVLWDDFFLEILEWTDPLSFESKNRDVEYVDANALGQKLQVRSLREADFFYPVNGVGRKKLSDFFVDEKVPFSERRNVPIVESDDKIVWIAGYRLDDRFKVTDKTKRIFKLTIGTRGQ